MITAKITSIKKKISRLGGYYYHIFFKGENSESYFTYVYPRMMNYNRWKKVLKEGIILSNLRLLKGKKNLINADSNFKKGNKMNRYCRICKSAFGIVEDYSEPCFVMTRCDIISRKYKCQDCGATFTYNKKTDKWEFDNNITLKNTLEIK